MKKEEAEIRRGGKTILKSGQEWNLSSQLGQLKTGTRWKGIDANLSVVPRWPSPLMIKSTFILGGKNL